MGYAHAFVFTLALLGLIALFSLLLVGMPFRSTHTKVRMILQATSHSTLFTNSTNSI